MQEVKINNTKINARNEISFKVTIKEWDYTVAERELLKQAEINWDMLDLNIVWLVNWDSEKQNKANLVKLNWIMMVYCDKSNTSMDIEKFKLYKKYKVSSRRDISASDVESEIESYRVWLLEFN